MKKSYLFPLTLLLVLAGCGGKKYQKITLKQLNDNTSQFTKIDNKIKLEVRLLDDQEIKNVFGSQAKNLLKNKQYRINNEIVYTPLKAIHCLLTNNSTQPISLSETNISMPLISNYSLETLLKPSYFWNRIKLSSKIGILSVATLISSFVCFGAFNLLGLAVSHHAHTAWIALCSVPALGSLAGLVTCGGLIITSQHTYKNSSREKVCIHNHAIKDIEEKYPNNIILYPEEKKDLLFFVSHKDFKKEFEFSVHTLNEKITFNVDLDQEISKVTDFTI